MKRENPCFPLWGSRERRLSIIPAEPDSGIFSFLHSFNSSFLHYVKNPGLEWTDPGRKDKEKKTLSQNSSELRGLAPDFKRSEAVF